MGKFDDVVGQIPATDIKAQENAPLFLKTVPELFPKIDANKDQLITKEELQNAATNGFRGETSVEQKSIDIMLKGFDLFASASGVNECNSSHADDCSGPSSAITMDGINQLQPGMFGLRSFKDILQANAPSETSGQIAGEVTIATVGMLAGAVIGARFGGGGGTLAGMLVGFVAPPLALHAGVQSYRTWKIGHDYDSKWAPQVNALQQGLRGLE